jgi:hypothetical protein
MEGLHPSGFSAFWKSINFNNYIFKEKVIEKLKTRWKNDEDSFDW